MEPFYKYYVVQVQTAFVANKYCVEKLTLDEEQAHAFTNADEADACAIAYAGQVKERQVSEQELAEIEADFCGDFSLNDFCQQLAEL